MLIFNASPIILTLEELNEPSLFTLFKKLDKDIIIPQIVVEEIISKRAKSNLEKLISEGLVLICNNKERQLIHLTRRFPFLDDGEITVLSRVYEDKTACRAVIDEMKGREVAKEMGLPVNGIFGLLLELYNKKEIDLNKLKGLCKRIDESPFKINFEKLGYGWLLK